MEKKWKEDENVASTNLSPNRKVTEQDRKCTCSFEERLADSLQLCKKSDIPLSFIQKIFPIEMQLIKSIIQNFIITNVTNWQQYFGAATNMRFKTLMI